MLSWEILHNTYDINFLCFRNVSSLPQYFKSQGYWSEGIGKIFHRGHGWVGNDPISWSVPFRSIRQEGNNNMK